MLIVGATSFTGCGGFLDSVFGDGSNDNGNGDGGDNGLGPFGPGADGGDPLQRCTGLCLRQVQCANGGTTSLSGVVKDPAGKIPLYNVLVYVPNAPVAAITSGVSCDRCGSVSGDPLVTTLTDTDGHFKLDNVPVGKDVPLVVQVGKWRRQLVVPNVPQCVDTPLDANDIRLPKNKSEGDIPLIALTTGGADVMECWLRKVGLEDSEFTTNAGTGRVHFYAGGGSHVTTAFSGAAGGQSFPSAQAFWSDQARLSNYDIVIFSCEGETLPDTKGPAALDALKGYANAGGRVFTSHWHRYWFSTAAQLNSKGQVQDPAGPQPSPFEAFGTWNDRNDPPDPSSGTIDTSFPKGQAMKQWLGSPAVAGLDSNGLLSIKEPRHNVDTVDPTKATQWITLNNSNAGGQKAVEYLSFNTPIPAPEAQKCGRVVYSDLHVSSGDTHGPAWPDGCQTKDLSPQEKALEFMLFDLSSCIQSDKEPPKPPVVR
jgi:hypothetical protein